MLYWGGGPYVSENCGPECPNIMGVQRFCYRTQCALCSALIVTAFTCATFHSGNDKGKSSSVTSASTQFRLSPNVHRYVPTS